jgi:hypothetical protein
MFGTSGFETDLGAGYGAMALVTGLLATVPWDRVLGSAAGACCGLADGFKDIFVRLRARYRHAYQD